MEQHSALLWCSAAESRGLKGRPPAPPGASHQRDESEHAPGQSSEGAEVCPDPCRRQLLAVFHVSSLCNSISPTQAVCNKKHGGFLEEGLSMHRGAACQALCSCTQALLGACAALKPCQCPVQPRRRPDRIRCWKLERSQRHKADLVWSRSSVCPASCH